MANIIFMGTSPFACACLDGLEQEQLLPSLIVTRPDSISGRNRRPTMPPVKKWALTRELETWQPGNINSPENINKLRGLDPDLLIVVAYGKILKGEVLAIPKLGAINVHASLLPDLRGAAPIEWALILGRTETGITTMYMDEGLDTGDIILQEALPIPPDMTGGELHGVLASMAKTLLPETIRQVLQGTAPRRPQDQGDYPYAPVLDGKLEQIDWNLSAQAIANRVRALSPKPGCYCAFRGKRLKVLKAEAKQGSFAPGRIAFAGNSLCVGTGEGLLELLELQPEGKRVITAGDLKNGYRIQEGEQLQ